MIKDRKNKSVDYFPSWGGEEWNTLHNQAREKKKIPLVEHRKMHWGTV